MVARGVQTKNYLLLWRPNFSSSVDTYRAIDAWSSTGTLQEQRDKVWNTREVYWKQFGRGDLQVVLLNAWMV